MEITLFDNYNSNAVGGAPAEHTTFNVAETRHVTSLSTYHYLIGNAHAGTIALRHSDGTLYGPWQAMGLDVLGMPNRDWWHLHRR